MSTNGASFAGATQDEEFEALLQATYDRYHADDFFELSNLLIPEASVLAVSAEPIPTSKVVTYQPISQKPSVEAKSETSEHSIDDQDYAPKRAKKRKLKGIAKSLTPSESSTSDKQRARKNSQKLIQPDDLNDLAKGIERLKNALAKVKEKAQHKTIPGDLTSIQLKEWISKEKHNQSSRIGRYLKAIAELEEKQEIEKLKKENIRLNNHNRSLLHANAELNKKMTSLKSTHEEVLKSFAVLKDEMKALIVENEKNAKESAETIDDLCKKLTALKEAESQKSASQIQIHELSVEKVQLRKTLDDAKKTHQQAEQNMQTVIEKFESLVAHYEAEQQVEKQKVAAAEIARVNDITRMRTEFEQVIRPLQERIESLRAQEARQVDYIVWLEKKTEYLELQSVRQSDEYNEITSVLQRREQAFDVLEYQYRNNLAHIRSLETEVERYRSSRLPNPPLIYSPKYRQQSQLMPPVDFSNVSSQNRSKFS